MKTTSPFPVTAECFISCWEYVDRARRKSRVMCAIAKIGGFLSNLFLLFSLLFLANGLIYSHFDGLYHGFLASIPGFSSLWETFTSVLLNPGDALTAQVLKLLLGCYILSAVLFIALALVIALIYHPRKQPIPEGTYEEQTTLLSKAAQEAWSKSLKTKLSSSIVSMVLVIAAAFVLLSGYIVYSKETDAVKAFMSTFPTPDFTVNCWIYVFAGFLICHIFSTIFLLLTRFVYRYQFPYDQMAQAEAAVFFASEELQDLSQEDLALHRSARAEALRLEALSLEKEAAYGKAKSMLHDAALMGDVPAMEHFARHCIILHLSDSARYWLKRCISSGEAGKDARRMLLRLNLGLKHKVQYLRPDTAPLTTGQKVLKAIKTVLTIVWRVSLLAMLFGTVAVCILLFKTNFDPAVFQDLPGAFSQLLS